MIEKSRLSLLGDQDLSDVSDSELELASGISHRKSLTTISLKQQRVRLSKVLECIKEIAEVEDVSEISIAALALQLISNQKDNRQVVRISKTIAYEGDFGDAIKKRVSIDKSLFLLDFLEIGKRKYTSLRQLLLPNGIEFPAYQEIIEERNLIVLRPHLQLYPNLQTPIGIFLSYLKMVKHTLERILSNEQPVLPKEYPLSFQIADGLDGSGNHSIYNQSKTNKQTKNYLLFCFKPISVTTVNNKVIWQSNSLNSTFSQRPVFICAMKESEQNIRMLMCEFINPDTDRMKLEGITLPEGFVHVKIVRSMIDGKMSGILSGAGGASCQMRTANHEDLKDRELVLEGFPINRHVSDAIELFGEVEDVGHFLSLPTIQRFNFTHEPISTIDINSASPLHAYTCIFRWFNLLIYHLNIRKKKWAPTSPQIKGLKMAVGKE